MEKKSITSLELVSIITELQLLQRGKLGSIYHQQNNEVIIQVHAKQKYLLKIIPGKWCCITTHKNPPLRPTGFCMLLRKYIEHATIKSITQKDTERILIITLEKPETYYFIVELYSKGNIILTDEHYTIIAALDKHTWKDRAIKEKETYTFPQSSTNYKTITEQQLHTIIQTSDKKNIATTLATQIGLGGIYAEELLKIAEIDKNQKPTETTKTQTTKLHNVLKKIIAAVEHPQGYLYETELTPIPLINKTPTEIKESFNQTLDSLNPYKKASPYEKKITSLQKLIEAQENFVTELNESITENTKKAETIYNNYPKLQQLKEIVTELKKTKNWTDIETELKKEKKIKSINLKDKKITIDLN